jgi:predicted phosphoribosyltransferase
MGNLIEEVSLRDKHYIFNDRKEAGQLLAEKLVRYKDSDGIVLGIPAGGLPVAKEIAERLNLPMDLIIARKIQIPYNPETGFGAMDPDGEVILDERLLGQLGLTREEIEIQKKKTGNIIKRRNQIFRGDRPFPSLKDKIVIVVDDGLASGYTMLSSIRYIKKRNPLKVIVSVPTGSQRIVDFILPEVDELVCLNIRGGLSFAVADAYRKWYDLSDEEVISLLRNSRNFFKKKRS